MKASRRHSSLFRSWRLGALLTTLVALPASAADERPIAGPRLPPLTCYAGYLKLEAPHGLEGVRAALRQALARKDQAALLFLEQRLAEVIGEDAQAALQVIEWAHTAQEPEMSLYLRAVRETGAVRSPAVVDRLATLPRNTRTRTTRSMPSSPWRRSTASSRPCWSASPRWPGRTRPPSA
ncbi:MAG TPA: hypothetical protein VEZ71_03220 [Archangium sp.]|nr:hypothetical protein [Archangium sp.]